MNIDNIYIAARRRAAAKKKLKNLGKSKSTDTEEEEQDEDCGDDGQYNKQTDHSKIRLYILIFVSVFCKKFESIFIEAWTLLLKLDVFSVKL